MSFGPLSISSSKRLNAITNKPKAVQSTDMTAEQANKKADSRPFAKLRTALNNIQAAAYVKAAQWAHLQPFAEPIAFTAYVGIEQIAAHVGSGVIAKGLSALSSPEVAKSVLKPPM